MLWRGTALSMPTMRLGLEDVRLCAPIQDPDTILWIGLTYKDHAEEIGMTAPSARVVFAKFRNSLIGATDPIVLPENRRCSSRPTTGSRSRSNPLAVLPIQLLRPPL